MIEDDGSLVKRICSGETDLFRHLIRNYQHASMSIAMSIIKDEFIAEEVIQDAFVKAYQQLNNFKHHSKFSTWLYKIVTNESLMRLRKMKVDKLQFYETLPETELEDISLYRLECKEMQQMIYSALQRLAPNESLSLSLFYLEEGSLNDICEITGWSLSNAKTILHRARKKLAHLLNEQMKQS
jgi:RNA polymerase sigma factor (sigma-70 family)